MLINLSTQTQTQQIKKITTTQFRATAQHSNLKMRHIYLTQWSACDTGSQTQELRARRSERETHAQSRRCLRTQSIHSNSIAPSTLASISQRLSPHIGLDLAAHRWSERILRKPTNRTREARSDRTECSQDALLDRIFLRRTQNCMPMLYIVQYRKWKLNGVEVKEWRQQADNETKRIK